MVLLHPILYGDMSVEMKLGTNAILDASMLMIIIPISKHTCN